MSATLFTGPAAGPVVIGHRGTGCGIGPTGARENTIAALDAAFALGAAWVEFDVQLSADLDLMLTHDVVIDGEPVRRLSTAELCRRGLETLDAAHAELPPGLGFQLELKVGPYDVAMGGPHDIVAAGARWAEAATGARSCLVSSFCPSILVSDATVPKGVIKDRTADLHEGVMTAIRFGADFISVAAGDVLAVAPSSKPSPAVIRDLLARHDIALITWDVLPAHVPALVSSGVTGLCGDDVAGIVAALG